jgi:hypothetical protein
MAGICDDKRTIQQTDWLIETSPDNVTFTAIGMPFDTLIEGGNLTRASVDTFSDGGLFNVGERMAGLGAIDDLSLTLYWKVSPGGPDTFYDTQISQLLNLQECFYLRLTQTSHGGNTQAWTYQVQVGSHNPPRQAGERQVATITYIVNRLEDYATAAPPP